MLFATISIDGFLCEAKKYRFCLVISKKCCIFAPE